MSKDEGSRQGNEFEKDEQIVMEDPGKLYNQEILPIMPLRSSVFFPRQMMPLSVARKSTIQLADEAFRDDLPILIVAQKDANTERPTPEDIHKFGTISRILKVYNLPDGSKSVFVQGLYRAQIFNLVQQEPYMKGFVQRVDERKDENIEIEALIATIKNGFKKAVDLVTRAYARTSWSYSKYRRPKSGCRHGNVADKYSGQRKAGCSGGIERSRAAEKSQFVPQQIGSTS